MKALFLAISLTFAVSANAALLTTSAETVVLSQQTVPATATLADGTVLTSVMAALREHDSLGGLIKTPIYVLQILGDQPATFVKSENFKGKELEDNETVENLYTSQSKVALRLNFQYPVEGSDLFKAFATAFKANKVDVKAEANKSFLAQVKASGGMVVGKNIVFLVVKNADGTETVTYENDSAVTETAPDAAIVFSVTGPAGFGKEILAIWLGNIDKEDSGLQRTKVSLLQ